ncbi:hydantoinase/oxoprolinase family protein [Botrimarina hoheduenensis]|uniref:Hydantoinase/oxoprolinase n=1 Tax=Botrimarina hoheduenensis TaxID=2528000 RepID=A0A5C5VX97_9BACT|nr:hydantoinase/oxoprolinase family protein [Botrimarina hoheduenensis]TWT42757.1 Hydantoinase/oxoprolinase [Botrimarina hoheduenensis]
MSTGPPTLAKSPPGQPSRWVGLDVGGANLKASDGVVSVSTPFALWRTPELLSEALRALITRLPPADAYAATMTGELADCYPTKAAGVTHIVNALSQLAGDSPLWIATNDDRWVGSAAARAQPLLVAAANWRLLARWAAAQTGAAVAMVVDVGSTTTDLTLLSEGRILGQSPDDTQRLIAGELLYQGVRRTPICALVDRLPYRGTQCPIAAEWFATTADVWLIEGALPASERTDTADGMPLSLGATQRRLARCVCADEEDFTLADARAVAQAVADKQVALTAQALDRLLPTGATLIAAGEGDFVVRYAKQLRGWQNPLVSLSETIGPIASECGPAYAAARLADLEIAQPSADAKLGSHAAQ